MGRRNRLCFVNEKIVFVDRKLRMEGRETCWSGICSLKTKYFHITLNLRLLITQKSGTSHPVQKRPPKLPVAPDSHLEFGHSHSTQSPFLFWQSHVPHVNHATTRAANHPNKSFRLTKHAIRINRYLKLHSLGLWRCTNCSCSCFAHAERCTVRLCLVPPLIDD